MPDRSRSADAPPKPHTDTEDADAPLVGIPMDQVKQRIEAALKARGMSDEEMRAPSRFGYGPVDDVQRALRSLREKITPDASSAVTTSRADKPRDSPLTLDDRAVALLLRWAKESRPKISQRALADELECHHSSLRDCPSFQAAWKSFKGTPRRGYRHADTGDVEAVDDD